MTHKINSIKLAPDLCTNLFYGVPVMRAGHRDTYVSSKTVHINTAMYNHLLELRSHHKVKGQSGASGSKHEVKGQGSVRRNSTKK